MSKRLGKVLAGAVRGATRLQKPWRRAASRLRAAEGLMQRHGSKPVVASILFVSPQARALEYPRDFLSREPEMLDWIDGFVDALYLSGISAPMSAAYVALRCAASRRR